MSNMPPTKRHCVDCSVTSSPQHQPPCGHIDPLQKFLNRIDSGRDTECSHCLHSIKGSPYNAQTDVLQRSDTCPCTTNESPPPINFLIFLQNALGVGVTLAQICDNIIDINGTVNSAFLLGLVRLNKLFPDTIADLIVLNDSCNGVIDDLKIMIVDYSKYVTLIQLLRKYLLSVNLYSIELISDRVISLSCADFLELYNSLANYPSLQEMLLAKHNLSITLLHLCLDDRFVGKGKGCSKVYEMQKALREKQLINTLPLEEQPIQ